MADMGSCRRPGDGRGPVRGVSRHDEAHQDRIHHGHDDVNFGMLVSMTDLLRSVRRVRLKTTIVCATLRYC